MEKRLIRLRLGGAGTRIHERDDQADQREDEAGNREKISNHNVEGRHRTPGNRLDFGPALEQRGPRGNLAAGFDNRANAGIGHTYHRSFGLDCTHRGHREQLIERGTLAIPGVVGDIYEYIGPALDGAPREVGKDAFIADENTEPRAFEGENRLFAARKHITEAFDDAVDQPAQEIAQRYVLAKRHEVDLVVPGRDFAVAGHQIGAIVEAEAVVFDCERGGAKQKGVAGFG